MCFVRVSFCGLVARCSAATVTATLHYNASVGPQDTLTVLAGVLAASGTSGPLTEESTAFISPPDDPPVPILVPEVWYTALAHCQVSTVSVRFARHTLKLSRVILIVVL